MIDECWKGCLIMSDNPSDVDRIDTSSRLEELSRFFVAFHDFSKSYL